MNISESHSDDEPSHKRQKCDTTAATHRTLTHSMNTLLASSIVTMTKYKLPKPRQQLLISTIQKYGKADNELLWWKNKVHKFPSLGKIVRN